MKLPALDEPGQLYAVIRRPLAHGSVRLLLHDWADVVPRTYAAGSPVLPFGLSLITKTELVRAFLDCENLRCLPVTSLSFTNQLSENFMCEQPRARPK